MLFDEYGVPTEVVGTAEVVEYFSVVVWNTVEDDTDVDVIDESHSGTLKGQSHHNFIGLKTNPPGQYCKQIYLWNFNNRHHKKWWYHDVWISIRACVVG